MRQDIRDYWERHPNASVIGADRTPGTREYFETIENHRYEAEPCIREMAQFENWAGRRVLEIGCGIGTDLRQFARHNAVVVGLDLTWEGVRLAKKGFELFGLRGDFVVADAEALPFKRDVFDLCYSHGVIHHTPDIPATIAGIRSVLRHGGEARVMVYHRNSYFARFIVGIVLRGIIRGLLLLFPRGRLPGLILRSLPRGVTEMYTVLAAEGYSAEKLLALATDPSWAGKGNFNPFSRCYSRAEARLLFSQFRTCETKVRQLYLAGFMPVALRQWLERRVGWFLYVRCAK